MLPTSKTEQIVHCSLYREWHALMGSTLLSILRAVFSTRFVTLFRLRSSIASAQKMVSFNHFSVLRD